MKCAARASFTTPRTRLFAAQLFGGVAWAAYELATFLAFFDQIERRERISVPTTNHAANALAITVGSIGGGLLLGALGSDAGAYAALFAGSTVLRLGG